MIDLQKITLCAISSVKISETIKAIDICKDKCIFKNIIFFTDVDAPYAIKIPRINSIADYNNFILHKLPDLILPIMSDYLLTIHWDGFIINSESWTDSFYSYDYVGAPWPWLKDLCGNGGFCLKSKKFLQIQKDIISNKIKTHRNEDMILCRNFRQKFINHGCRYAEPGVAYLFSRELPSKRKEYQFEKPFGFHSFVHNPQYKYLIQ